jgi:hypothetical protein
MRARALQLRLVTPVLAALAIVALTLLIQVVDVESGADNVLVNPGFEDGLTGWQGLEGSFQVQSSNVRTGQNAARVITGQASQIARFVQEGSAFLGEWDATIFVSSAANGTLATLVLEFQDANNVLLLDESTTLQAPTVGFQDLSLSLTAPPGTTNYRFLVEFRDSPNAIADFDDAFLAGVAAPPPTATSTPTPPETPTPSPTPDGGGDDDDEEAELAASLYLRNPTFEIEEDGLSRHWQAEGGRVLYTQTLARSGFAAGHAVGNLSTPITIRQTVRLLNENTRRFAVYALASPPGGTVQLEIQWLIMADQPIAEPVRTDPVALDGVGYQEISLVSTPPPRAAGAILTITVVNGSMGDNVRLDDASWRTSRSLTSRNDSGDTDGAKPGGGSSGEPSTTSRPADLNALVDSTSDVLITEVYYAAESGEAEWIELRNAGEESVHLSGWTLFDNQGQLELDSTLLAPGGYFVVMSEGLMPSTDSAFLSPTGKIGNGLANDGDQLILLDESGAHVDAVSWGDDHAVFESDPPSAATGNSISRLAGAPDTDSPADFQAAYPTPMRGLAAFEISESGAESPTSKDDENSGEETDDAAGAAQDDSSESLSAWVLVLIILAVIVAVSATTAWFRRDELAEELSRMRDNWRPK